MHESEIQKQCYMWFNNTYIMHDDAYVFIYIKNEFDYFGSKTKLDRVKQGTRDKALGKCNGAPDVVIFSPIAVPLFIELKASRGVHANNQKQFASRITKTKAEYKLCRSVEQFKEIVMSHFNSNPC